MSQLRIADLTENKTLAHRAMTAVCGGIRTFGKPGSYWGPSGDQFVAVNPTQAISQFQGLDNAVGNNVANFGFSNLNNANYQNQQGQNNVNVGGLL